MRHAIKNLKLISTKEEKLLEVENFLQRPPVPGVVVEEKLLGYVQRLVKHIIQEWNKIALIQKGSERPLAASVKAVNVAKRAILVAARQAIVDLGRKEYIEQMEKVVLVFELKKSR